MFRRPVPRGELVEEAAASEEEEVDSWSTSDEEEQEDSRDYCKGQGTEVYTNPCLAQWTRLVLWQTCLVWLGTR